VGDAISTVTLADVEGAVGSFDDHSFDMMRDDRDKTPADRRAAEAGIGPSIPG